MAGQYTFQRGETILLALDVIEGEAGPGTSITARLEAAGSIRREAQFEVSWREAEGEISAGWTLALHPAYYEAELPPGTYLADARIVHEGVTIIADPINVRLVNSPSSAA